MGKDSEAGCRRPRGPGLGRGRGWRRGRKGPSVWWARPCSPRARGCCRREGRGPRAACLSGQPRGALAWGPPPLVPPETPGSHLAVTGPSFWVPQPPGLPSPRPAWVLPLGWEASAGAGGWPPSVLWKLPLGESCWLLSGWRRSELGHCGPHHSPTAEAAAPDPSPDVACGPGGLGRGPPGHLAQKPCSGLGPGGRVRVSEWGKAVLGAQMLSLSLPGHASGGAAWPRRPGGECPVSFPLTCGVGPRGCREAPSRSWMEIGGGRPGVGTRPAPRPTPALSWQVGTALWLHL